MTTSFASADGRAAEQAASALRTSTGRTAETKQPHPCTGETLESRRNVDWLIAAGVLSFALGYLGLLLAPAPLTLL